MESLFPLIRNWRTLLACYLVWVLYLLSGHWTGHPITSGWRLASISSAPFTHISGFAFLAPLPWIVSRRLKSPWGHISGFFLSVIVCECIAVLLVVPDAWLLTKAHMHFNRAGINTIYLSLVGPAMMVVGGLIATKTHADELRRASQVEATVAKNRLLQSQIHPHVLFNALNGLAELVHKDPSSAERAIRHLADLLRRIMRASEHTRWPLREERAILEDYLALEAIRLTHRLKVIWDWDEALNGCELPPLMLQPLAENAIKHGLSPSLTGGDLLIRAQIQGNELLLEVWNSGEPFHPGRSESGIGIDNLISRLNIHFHNGATFSLGSTGNGTLASIRIDIEQIGIGYEAN